MSVAISDVALSLTGPPYKVLFGADPKFGLSSSIPKELLPQLETEEDLEQILADAGEGDTTNGTLVFEQLVFPHYRGRFQW
jgi:hypothetical protein